MLRSGERVKTGAFAHLFNSSVVRALSNGVFEHSTHIRIFPTGITFPSNMYFEVSSQMQLSSQPKSTDLSLSLS